MKRVLVLLIGEVLDDPRVHKTCRSLADAGAAVTVACTNPLGRPEREDRDGLRILRVSHWTESLPKRLYNLLQDRLPARAGSMVARGHEDVPRTILATLSRNFIMGWNFNQYLRETHRIRWALVETVAGERFDLVHANDIDTLEAGAAIKAAGRATVLLYDAHEYWPGIGVRGSIQHARYIALERTVLPAADFVVTVNPRIAERMASDYGLARVPATVLNCPPLADTPEPADDPAGPVRIVYQGKLQAFRGLPELVAAMAELPDQRLTLAGYGPLEARLRRQAAELGIADRVTFAGRYHPADTLDLLAGHHIGVMPFRNVTESIEFAAPNKLFDYMMAGLALAGSDFPFLAGMIRGRDLGCLFPETSPAGIAAVLRDMAADRPRLLEWRWASYWAARDEFNWEAQFTNYPWRP